MSEEAASVVKWMVQLRSMDNDYSKRSTNFDAAVAELVPALTELRASSDGGGMFCAIGTEVLWQLILGHAANKERMATTAPGAVKFLCDEVALNGVENYAIERSLMACKAIGSLAYTNTAGALAVQSAVPAIVALLAHALESVETHHDEKQLGLHEERMHSACGALFHLAAHGCANSVLACAAVLPYLTRVVTRRPAATTQTTASLAIATMTAVSEEHLNAPQSEEASAAAAILALVQDTCLPEYAEPMMCGPSPTVPLHHLIWLSTKPLLPLLSSAKRWHQVLGAAVVEAVARDRSPRASPVALLWSDGVADALLRRWIVLRSNEYVETDDKSDQTLELTIAERAIRALGVRREDDVMALLDHPESGESCPLCLEDRTTYTLQPCRHCVCVRCACVMRASSNLRCPLCRTAVIL